ncbi:MAG: hypothetical protein AAF183_13005 [Pseudomonadota bacterium]
MTASQAWPLQQALYARLSVLLAGRAPDGSDVPVYDHAPQNPPQVHARLDGSNIVPGQVKSRKARHFFTVHVFDRPTSEGSVTRGQRVVKELQSTIVGGLEGWTPAVTGASAVQHENSDIAPDQDGLTQHADSRFSIYIGD